MAKIQNKFSCNKQFTDKHCPTYTGFNLGRFNWQCDHFDAVAPAKSQNICDFGNFFISLPKPPLHL
ncbi:MAG: hypothetical protein J1E29_05840, partial [Duncaniella sp.]|nr:hypothetical protein [Duncaniella sp.]